MNETDLIWMSLVVFLPSVFAIGLLFFPKGWEEAMRWWSLFGTALTLGVSVGVFIMFKVEVVDNYASNRSKMSLVERAKTADMAAEKKEPPPSKDWIGRTDWIKRFNIEYFLGTDGISMPLALLTTLLAFLAMIASWNIEKFVRGYCILFLVLETGMLGTFLALDFFLFYIFWEVMLLPMYFLIGVWGGPRREYAAIKFFLYTLLGSVFILIAMLAFYFTDVRDFVNPEKVYAAAQEKLPKAVRDAVANSDTALNQAKKEAEDVKKLVADDPDKVKAEAEKVRGELAKAKTDQTKAQAELLRFRQPGPQQAAARAKLTEAEKAVADAEKKLVGLDPIRAANAVHDAEVKLDAALLARDADIAKQSAPVNTFDMILLQQVGKAAMEHRNGKAVPSPTLERAARFHQSLKDRYGPSPGAAEKKNLEAAEKAVGAAEDGLKKRLDQPFFQPWFQYTMFLFLFVGFAVKVPLFPFHTWLPDAHVEAPTPISMILAGVLLKFGGYGIIRIAYPICPWAAHQLAWWIALFGIINIVYGALAAMAQTDFKKLVAYSSVSHMGYVILGIAVWSVDPDKPQYWSWAMNGAMFQMLAHGLTSAGMFFCVGVIYDRAHHRNLDNFRGLYDPMPLYGGISAVIFFAAMGLPGMCGFVGEFMVVLGTWDFSKTFAILAALTVVITAAYILWTLQRVFMGTNPTYKNYADITPRELTAIVPLVALSVLFGILPALILTSMGMEPSVTGLIDSLLASR